MIKLVKSGDGFAYVCDCGNGDQTRFTNTALASLTIDDRGRKHNGRQYGVQCNDCESITTGKELTEQFTKKVDLTPADTLD